MNRSINLRPRQIYSAVFSSLRNFCARIIMEDASRRSNLFNTRKARRGEKMCAAVVFGQRCKEHVIDDDLRSFYALKGPRKNKQERFAWNSRHSHTGMRERHEALEAGEHSIRNNKFNQKNEGSWFFVIFLAAATKAEIGESCKSTPKRRNFHSVTSSWPVMMMMFFLRWLSGIWAFELSRRRILRKPSPQGHAPTAQRSGRFSLPP